MLTSFFSFIKLDARKRQSTKKQSSAETQKIIGGMYLEGKGVVQDYSRAIEWFKKSASQNNSSSQYVLGTIFQFGKGVTQDYIEAAKWYKLSAENGNATAQLFLAIMYGNGHGVPQDYVKAHMWFNLAAAKGNKEAIERRDLGLKILNQQQIAEAQKLARECEARKYKGC